MSLQYQKMNISVFKVTVGNPYRKRNYWKKLGKDHLNGLKYFRLQTQRLQK